MRGLRRRAVDQDRRDASYEQSVRKFASSRALLEGCSTEYLTKVAAEEGALARVAIEYHAKLETVYYFAREAARYAAVVLERGK